MTFRTLILRSLSFHARLHLGVLLGATVGSAVLIGALVVGDSVRESLRERALERLGKIQYALLPNDRMFRDELASDLKEYFTQKPYRYLVQGGEFVTAIKLPATAERTDGTGRANQVQLIGVDEKFAVLASDDRFKKVAPDAVLLNEPLAAQLGVSQGDVVVLRAHKPSNLTREASMSPRSDSTLALRLRVHDIVPAGALGNFNLSTSHPSPQNAFVSMAMLQEKTGMTRSANLILMERAMVETYVARDISKPERLLRNAYAKLSKRSSGIEFSVGRYGTNVTYYVLGKKKRVYPFENVRHWIWKDRTLLDGIVSLKWKLQDAGAQLHILPGLNTVELRTPRVFLDPQTVEAVYELPAPWVAQMGLGQNFLTNWSALINSNAQPILTYLVNLLRAGTNRTPYSMVSAAGAPWTPADLRDDEVIINQWLADDLQVKPGDEISLIYFDPESGARLIEHTNTFRVRAMVPMELPWADRTLMPDFPGIEKAESTHDWDAGFPLVHKIRQEDEDYWKKYRGTPKAFVTLAAGQRMWSNRFGNLTAIRFPIPTNTTMLAEQSAQGRAGSPLPAADTNTVDGAHGVTRPTSPAENYRGAIEKKILATLKPEEVGLRFEPVREQALKAAEQSQDFGQLFLGFSLFLIAAALLLMALLFQLGLEQRTAEVGTLLALGFPPRQVRRLLLLEGCVLAFIGGLIGALAGTVYAKAMLRGLTTIWQDAVGTSALHYYARPTTLMIGLLASTLIAGFTIWLALRKQGQRQARELLEEGAEEGFQTGRSRAGVIGVVATATAAALLVWAVWKGETRAAAIFFSAGALLLIGGLGFCGSWFAQQAHRTAANPRLTISGLGLRGCSRRRKRSLATVALLACGTFLIAAIGVFRLDATRDATKRSSGTGGFALIGESTLPVIHDVNSKEGRDFFGLNAGDLEGVSAVPFRVRDGDDASCLNLNRAQKPRLLGVNPEMLAGRFTFAKFVAGLNATNKWLGLVRENLPNGPGTLNSPSIFDAFVPAIGDANSIQWAMGKKVGDTIDYVDERGQTFKVRIVGAVANSILQGSLIINEAEFVKRFPSEAGYRMFLIDAPIDKGTEVSATLSRALQDVGLELQPTAQKLAAFNAVQNTYLSTFQILGGLGLLLGSAGLGVVVLRNVLERRGELALLLAVGFRARMLQWLVLSEHGALLWLGLGVGVIAAVVAVLPSLLSPGAEIPYLSLALTLAAVLVNGMIWTWLATRFALRGRLLDALRNE